MTMRNYILYVCCLLAVMAAGCYPEEFDNKTWGPEPQLELSAPGVTLQPTESSETITVTTNYEEWTAEVAADGREWCSVKQQENQLVIQVKENTGEKERTTVITVTVGNGKKETKEIAVTQLGTAPKIVVTPSALSFEMKGGTQEVTVTANVPEWTSVVSVGADWCSASKEGDVLKVGATAYAGREMREALITLTGNGNGATAVATLKVVQMGTDPVLTVADAAAFQATGGSQSLLVTTNRDSWTATVPSTASWCKAEQDGNNLKIITEANTGTTGRTCEVLVTAGTGEDILMYRLMVAQLGSENELILSTDEVRFEGQASMQTVSVFTNVAWEAVTDASWCTLLQGENTLTMYVEQNPSETQIRRGIVTVTAENLPAQQLNIIQLPDITLVLSVDTLVMPIEGGQQAVTVVTNQAHLSARNQDSIIWCWTNVSGNQLIVNAEPNEGAPRSIVVNVTAGTGEAIKTVPLVVRQEGLSSDRDILMAFYEATGGDNWTRNDNWGSDRPLSEWYGVTTEMIAPATKAGEPVERVVGLDMGGEYGEITYNGNNLTGTFPAVICGLTELRTLDLYNNELTGELPAELGNLSKLQSLSLSMNDWSGKLPAELGNLKELTHIGISSDYFDEQPLPDWLWSLSKLERMTLRCNFIGAIPAAIGNLTSLYYLDLGRNQLSGELPVELGNLTNLRYLWLCWNQFTGAIPEEIGNLTGLIQLRLLDNQFTGEIPVSFGNLTELICLDLKENQLTGSIPPELGNLTLLETLDLNDNYLTGYVPAVLAALPNWGTTITPEEDIFPQKNGYLQMETVEEGVYTVTLLLEGEAAEVNQAAGNHLYGVQVLSRAAGTSDSYLPYGYGIYTDSTRLQLDLEAGNEYTIYTTLVADGQNKVQPEGSLYAAPFAVSDYEVQTRAVTPLPDYDGDLPGSDAPALNVFVRDAVQGLPGIASGATVLAADGNRYDRPNTARYFGERLGYVPTGDGVLIVDMTRTLFTVTCEVENLTEGRIRVEIEGAPALYIDAVAAEHTVSDVFTFANPYGNWTDSGYSETAEVTFVWEKSNGLERVLSTETVTFVRGNAHLLSTVFSDDGMTMDIENKPLTDGEVINIEGIIW